MITIHEKTAQKFDTLGLGALLPGSCVVTEEINGSYELKLSHPYDEGGKWKRIERGRILYASTPRGMQPFRIYNTKPNMSGIEVNARHIFYDLLDNQCSEISFNGTASGALAALQGAFAFPMPFSFATDISVAGAMETGRMNPVQALLSDDDETTSFTKGFGGELLRDGFKVSILTAMGQDRDVSIRYGKNLVGLDVTEDEADVKTRILCYGSDGSATVDSPYIGEYVYPKIYTLEDEDKTVAELKAEAQALFDGGADLPLVNIKVDFVTLADTIEYANYAPLEEVFLGDIVTIINQKMNFAKMARVISYEWDCLLQRYNEVELGDFMPTLASSVTSGVRSGSLASAAAVGTSAVSAALQAHLNDFNNPHKTQTGGSSGTGDADAVLELLVEHEEDKNNPHAVTLEQVGFTSGTDDPDDANGADGDIYLQTGGESHTVVEYLESTGEQFVNTKVMPNKNTRVVAGFEMLQPTGTTWYKLWGSGSGSFDNDFSMWAKGAKQIQFYYGTQNKINSSVGGGEVVVDADKNSWTAEGWAVNFTEENFACDYPMYIFSINKDTTASYKNAPLRLKFFKIYEGESLVRDYVPVRKNDGVCCLFDNVYREYYYNEGTGEFAVGADVSAVTGAGTLWLKQNGTWTQVLKGAA